MPGEALKHVNVKEGARVKDTNKTNDREGGGLECRRRFFPLLFRYFDDARQRVARALAELLLAVSMVTVSRGACPVQGGGRAMLLELCLWRLCSNNAAWLH